MLKFRVVINYRYFLQGIGIIWLLIFSQICLATKNQVIAVRVCSSSNFTRITIESNSTLKYKWFFLNKPNRMIVDFTNIDFNSILRSIRTKIHSNDLCIKSAHIEKIDSKVVRILFEPKQNIKSKLFTLAPVSGFKDRLVIDFYPENRINIQNSKLSFTKKSNTKDHICQIRFLQNEIKRNRPMIVILDPGHGGEDVGAIGKLHTREKDVVLQIALRLRTLIEKEKNMRVYMTRNKDIFIPLDMRVAKAHQKHADLFVSIHADAFTSHKPSGSSVFALSIQGATSTAMKYLSHTQSNSNFINSIDKSGDRYLDHTIFDMVQSSTINDSMKFAEVVLKKLGKVNRLHNNNVEQAGFEVLKAPDIPSILVETAFISNMEEECKLRTAKFQQKVAKSIFSGMKVYFSDSIMMTRRE